MIESEADFAQALTLHSAPQQVAIFGIEQQEASAARAHQFTADGAVLAPDIVPAINALVGSAGSASLFVQPMLVRQLAEAPRITLFQRQLDALAQLLDEMQVVEHGVIAHFG